MFEHRIANVAMHTVMTVMGAALAMPFLLMMYIPFVEGL